MISYEAKGTLTTHSFEVVTFRLERRGEVATVNDKDKKVTSKSNKDSYLLVSPFKGWPRSDILIGICIKFEKR